MRVEIMRGESKARRGVTIFPDTEFEADYLANVFIGNKDRHVIVKSPMGNLGTVDAINVFVMED